MKSFPPSVIEPLRDFLTNLTLQEVSHLRAQQLTPLDYMHVKLALIKERCQLRNGIAQRTNVREDVQKVKNNVANFMKHQGWLPSV